jgi:DNA-binding winged helix-turn-helix (wHTH) protein
MTVQFGPFNFDPLTGTLERDGSTIPIQPQPARVLAILIERAGETVTREEIKRRIWVNTWVNFNEGLNFCIRQIRIALADEARRPTYLQTLPHRGYRFVADVEPTIETTMRRRTLLARKVMHDVAAAMF